MLHQIPLGGWFAINLSLTTWKMWHHWLQKIDDLLSNLLQISEMTQKSLVIKWLHVVTCSVWLVLSWFEFIIEFDVLFNSIFSAQLRSFLMLHHHSQKKKCTCYKCIIVSMLVNVHNILYCNILFFQLCFKQSCEI